MTTSHTNVKICGPMYATYNWKIWVGDCQLSAGSAQLCVILLLCVNGAYSYTLYYLMCDELRIMTKYQPRPVLRYLKFFLKEMRICHGKGCHNMTSEPNIKYGT